MASIVKTPRKRRRAALACLECRRRKIACSRDSPCVQCVAAHAQCLFRVYQDGPALEHPHPAPAEAPKPSGAKRGLTVSDAKVSVPITDEELPRSQQTSLPHHSNNCQDARITLNKTRSLVWSHKIGQMPDVSAVLVSPPHTWLTVSARTRQYLSAGWRRREQVRMHPVSRAQQ